MISKDSHYETQCWRCHTSYMLPRALYVSAKNSEKISFYCPYGHEAHFAAGETEEDKLRRERDRLQQQMAQREDMITNLQIRNHDLISKNDELTKESGRIKRRAAAGTCPCCNRTFRQLAAHMKTKHPQWERFGEVA